MKPNTAPPTLDEIGSLLDKKLNARFSEFEEKMDVGFEEAKERDNNNFSVLHDMIQKLRNDMNKGFDENERAHKAMIKQNEQDHTEIIETLSKFIGGIYTSTDK